MLRLEKGLYVELCNLISLPDMAAPLTGGSASLEALNRYLAFLGDSSERFGPRLCARRSDQLPSAEDTIRP